MASTLSEVRGRIQEARTAIQHAKDSIRSVERLPIDHPERIRLVEMDRQLTESKRQLTLLMEQELLVLEKSLSSTPPAVNKKSDTAPVAATQSSGVHIPIVMYEPEQSLPVYVWYVKSEEHWEKFLDRGMIPEMFRDGKSPGVMDFEDLEPWATYTLRQRAVPEHVAEFTTQQRQQEFAKAIVQDVARDGFRASEVEWFRREGLQAPEGAVDVMVRLDEDNAAGGLLEVVIGSAVLHTDGDAALRELERRVEERYARIPLCQFAGKHLQLALMAERVKDEDKLRAACKARGVRLYARRAGKVQRVVMQAASVPAYRAKPAVQRAVQRAPAFACVALR